MARSISRSRITWSSREPREAPSSFWPFRKMDSICGSRFKSATNAFMRASTFAPEAVDELLSVLDEVKRRAAA